MKGVLDQIFGWLPFGFGVPIVVGVGLTMLADEFKKFNAARICFYLSAAYTYGKILMWACFTSDRFFVRGILAFLVCGVVGVGLIEALRLTTHREAKSNPGSNLPSETSPKPGPEVNPTPISKSSSFSTLVPVATVSTGHPIRRIPFDENFNDPRVDFYRDLGRLSDRPFEAPPGITFSEKPLGDANVARIFLAELLQYYILYEIRVLQRGTLAFGITKPLGKETAVAKAIDMPPIPVPDPVPYSIKSLFRTLEGNEFLNVYSYSKSIQDGVETPHWNQLERTLWENREHPFVVPRETIISLSGNDHAPERSVQLGRPGFYRLKFTVTPMFGGNNTLPENFYTSWPSVDSYSCRIALDYEIQQRTDGGFAPNVYAQWVADLFAGMKRVMAP